MAYPSYYEAMFPGITKDITAARAAVKALEDQGVSCERINDALMKLQPALIAKYHSEDRVAIIISESRPRCFPWLPVVLAGTALW